MGRVRNVFRTSEWIGNEVNAHKGMTPDEGWRVGGEGGSQSTHAIPPAPPPPPTPTLDLKETGNSQAVMRVT